MKRTFVVGVLALGILLAVAGVAVAGTGNGAPAGQHYNLNLIGVPNARNADFSGGQGARIFVSRTGRTQFFVHGGTSYEVLDHNGTDGKVGSSISQPGIVFPYDAAASPTWRVALWIRLVGPKGSEVDWSSYYYDANGDTWVLYDTFSLDKGSKFSLHTDDLLKDGYQDMLWQLDPVTKFRNCQMRVYLLD